MKNIIIVVIITIATSCGFDSSKDYTFITTKEYYSDFYDKTEINLDTIIIDAKSDSSAYIKAFKKFCISQTVSSNMNQTRKDQSTYKSFELKNQEGINIAKTINFNNKTEIEENIKRKVFEASIDMKIEKLLVSAYKNKFSYKKGNLNGGVAVMGYVNSSPQGAFWIKNNLVYAANGTAKAWTNNQIDYAPEGIDFFSVKKAVE